MKHRIVFLAFVAGLLSFSLDCSDNEAVITPTRTQSSSESVSLSKKSPVKFFDDFETDEGWGIFEEIVGGSSCYGDGIGEVARSRRVASNGRYSLRVWANRLLSIYSNHVIANKQVSEVGQSGRWRYQLRAYIAPATGATGQAGPEFSMQNTRTDGIRFLTSTAGIQYRASPYEQQPGSWAIWKEDQTELAGWQVFLVQPIAAGKWYTIVVEADYDANRYIRFRLSGHGIDISIDLTSYSIAREAKSFDREAFWITLEGENLWNNCGTAGPFEYVVYYDQVKLHQFGGN